MVTGAADRPGPGAAALGSPRGARALLGALGAGALVSVALGTYARVHPATGRTLLTLGFSDLLHMKAWLTTAAVVLAAGQVLSALRLYGRLGRAHSAAGVTAGGRAGGAPGTMAVVPPAPPWVHRLHRSGGTLAVLVTLPVAFQCAWSLGFGTYSSRVLLHSVLGCVFYGVFVAKMLALHLRQPPRWAIPWLGGALALVLVGLWLTSSLWFFTHGGLSR